MSKYTSSGRLKAKHNPAFRDPKFFGGLCCVCKKRPREYKHEHYPHMCSKCRESRVFSKDLPFTHPEVQRAIREYDLKVHGPTPTGLPISQEVYDALALEKHRLEKQPERVQTLNTQLPAPPTSIAESAAIYRSTLKK